jgi:hypothetical protein
MQEPLLLADASQDTAEAISLPPGDVTWGAGKRRRRVRIWAGAGAFAALAVVAIALLVWYEVAERNKKSSGHSRTGSVTLISSAAVFSPDQLASAGVFICDGGRYVLQSSVASGPLFSPGMTVLSPLFASGVASTIDAVHMTGNAAFPIAYSARRASFMDVVERADFRGVTSTVASPQHPLSVPRFSTISASDVTDSLRESNASLFSFPPTTAMYQSFCSLDQQCLVWFVWDPENSNAASVVPGSVAFSNFTRANLERVSSVDQASGTVFTEIDTMNVADVEQVAVIVEPFPSGTHHCATNQSDVRAFHLPLLANASVPTTVSSAVASYDQVWIPGSALRGASQGALMRRVQTITRNGPWTVIVGQSAFVLVDAMPSAVVRSGAPSTLGSSSATGDVSAKVELPCVPAQRYNVFPSSSPLQASVGFSCEHQGMLELAFNKTDGVWYEISASLSYSASVEFDASASFSVAQQAKWPLFHLKPLTSPRIPIFSVLGPVFSVYLGAEVRISGEVDFSSSSGMQFGRSWSLGGEASFDASWTQDSGLSFKPSAKWTRSSDETSNSQLSCSVNLGLSFPIAFSIVLSERILDEWGDQLILLSVPIVPSVSVFASTSADSPCSGTCQTPLHVGYELQLMSDKEACVTIPIINSLPPLPVELDASFVFDDKHDLGCFPLPSRAADAMCTLGAGCCPSNCPTLCDTMQYQCPGCPQECTQCSWDASGTMVCRGCSSAQFYGQDCSQTMSATSACRGLYPWNQASGNCPSCLQTNAYGAQCDKVCPSDCSFSPASNVALACEQFTGECIQGCVTNSQYGPHCKTSPRAAQCQLSGVTLISGSCDFQCSGASFGRDCESTNGACAASNLVVDPYTGACTSMAGNAMSCAGQSAFADSNDCPSCPSGQYGPTCAMACPANCGGGVCDIDGHCVAGFCNQDTQGNSYWGPSCSKQCSANCWQYMAGITPASSSADQFSSCSFWTGHCLVGCNAGWWGLSCTELCPAGCNGCDRITGDCFYSCNSNTWGRNCDNTCDASCDTGCDPVSGACS